MPADPTTFTSSMKKTPGDSTVEVRWVTREENHRESNFALRSSASMTLGLGTKASGEGSCPLSHRTLAKLQLVFMRPLGSVRKVALVHPGLLAVFIPVGIGVKRTNSWEVTEACTHTKERTVVVTTLGTAPR